MINLVLTVGRGDRQVQKDPASEGFVSVVGRDA